jgi:Radical SAM superfamily
MLLDAIILNVPRIGPSRPSAGTSLIKTLLTRQKITNRLYDINIDFFNQFVLDYGSEQWHELDLYFYTENTVLSDSTRQSYTQFMNRWVEQILGHRPKYLLISVFTWQCQKFTTDFLRILRPLTDATIVIGGQGMVKSENTSFNERPYYAIELLDQQLIDYFIQGEAEKALPELLNGNVEYPGINSEKFAPRSDMSEVPYYDFSDHDIRAYHSGYLDGQLPLETSRGCVRRCVFCDWPLYHGGFRSKQGHQLFDEVIKYYTQHQVTNYYFNDSLMNGDLGDFRQFNQLLIEYYQQNNLPMKYLRYSGMYIVRKPNQFREEDFKAMSEAGADTLLIGVESGSDRIKKEMRKGFNNQDLDFTAAMCSKYGIRLYFLMIVGFPSETREDFEQTLTLLKKYQRYVADGTLMGINFGTTLTIGEGTPMYEYPEQFNLVGVDGKRPHDVFWIHKENTELTYKERILRRIEAQELAVSLGYTFWKGDDQLTFVKEKYQNILNENRDKT